MFFFFEGFTLSTSLFVLLLRLFSRICVLKWTGKLIYCFLAVLTALLESILASLQFSSYQPWYLGPRRPHQSQLFPLLWCSIFQIELNPSVFRLSQILLPWNICYQSRIQSNIWLLLVDAYSKLVPFFVVKSRATLVFTVAPPTMHIFAAVVRIFSVRLTFFFFCLTVRFCNRNLITNNNLNNKYKIYSVRQEPESEFLLLPNAPFYLFLLLCDRFCTHVLSVIT